VTCGAAGRENCKERLLESGKTANVELRKILNEKGMKMETPQTGRFERVPLKKRMSTCGAAGRNFLKKRGRKWNNNKRYSAKIPKKIELQRRKSKTLKSGNKRQNNI